MGKKVGSERKIGTWDAAKGKWRLKTVQLSTYMLWSALVTAYSWQTEECRWGTAGWSSGSRCSPCSAGLHQCCDPGSTSGWGALEGRGPSWATQFHRCCLWLDTQNQHINNIRFDTFAQSTIASTYVTLYYILLQSNGTLLRPVIAIDTLPCVSCCVMD